MSGSQALIAKKATVNRKGACQSTMRKEMTLRLVLVVVT